jgi:hypothetical protein
VLKTKRFADLRASSTACTRNWRRIYDLSAGIAVHLLQRREKKKKKETHVCVYVAACQAGRGLLITLCIQATRRGGDFGPTLPGLFGVGPEQSSTFVRDLFIQIQLGTQGFPKMKESDRSRWISLADHGGVVTPISLFFLLCRISEPGKYLCGDSILLRSAGAPNPVLVSSESLTREMERRRHTQRKEKEKKTLRGAI